MDGSDDYDDDVFDGDDDDGFPTDECEANSPEEDIQIARRAVTENDLPHAAFHVACALADNPLREDWKALLAAIVGRSEEPDELLEIEGEEVYIGIVAGRAFVLEQQGRFAEALALIGEAIEYDPRISYIPWATEWLLRAKPKDIEEAVESDTLTEFLHGLLRVGALEMVDDSHSAGFCRAFCSAVEHLPAGSGDFEYARCAILRRMDRFEDALAIAQALHSREGTWRSAICVAMVYREMGKADAALDSYREAANLDPSEVTTYLDMGDVLLGTGRFDEAEKEFDKACIIDDESPWAYPSMLYCRYFSENTSEDEKVRALDELEAFASAHPDNERAADLVEHLERLGEEAYVDYLPEPQEAIVHMVRHLLEDGTPLETDSLNVGLSHLEAPSAVMACRESLNLFANDDKCELALAVTHLQQPDPRACPADSIARLWSYNGFEASVAVRPPVSSEVIVAVTALAEIPFQLDTWWDRALDVTEHWDEAVYPDLLACMVHPPESRIDSMPWIWMQRVQVAVAFLLGPMCQRSWISSPTSNPLLALCYGTKDWILNGAIIVLTRLALDEEGENERVLADVERALEHLENTQPNGGFCCYAHCLIWHLLQFPDLAQDREQVLQARLQEIEEPSGDSENR
ncbi:MAG: tetratricopeptide repeat protein [Verrucomicrobiae bacterium]|nr:tetratricopeptide repeat protein [Verrucomicrobiae bacterium]